MTSQDSSWSPHESGENVNKCQLLQEVKHAGKNVAENGHYPATRDQHRERLCSNDIKKALGSDSVQSANPILSDKERDLNSCKSDHEIDKPSNSLSPVQQCDFSPSSIVDVFHKLRTLAVSSNISQKLPLSTMSSDVSHQQPLSTVSSDVYQKLPLSSITSDVSHKLPLSVINDDVSQKLPLSVINTDVSQKLPMSGINTDVCQKMTMSSNSSDVSEKVSLSAISSEVSQKLELPSKNSDVSQSLPLTSISSYVSKKLQSSIIRSDVKNSNCSQMDNVCNKHVCKLQEKIAVGNARERFISALEIENRCSSFSNVCTVKSNNWHFESYLKDNIKMECITKKNVSRDQVSNVDGSNPSLVSANTRGNFKKKYFTPRQVSKTSEALSTHAASSEGDSIFSKQVGQQKGRSCVSTSSAALRMMHCPSPSMQTSKPDPSLSSEILIPTTVKLLKSKFGGMDQRPEKITSGSASSSVCSQNARVLCTRVKINPSSAIQRIQEQLFQKVENDEVRYSSSKTMQALVHKTISHQHQVAETNASELSGKSNSEHTDKLHKEEKPYRQWHRMSRVVTADSKFIISHMLPCHVNSYTTQTNPVPEKIVESIKIEDAVKTEEKKCRSVVNELEDVTTVVDYLHCEQESETSENTEILEDVVKIDTAVTEMPVTNEGMINDGETVHAESCYNSMASALHTPSDDGVQIKNDIASETSDNTENSTNKQKIEQPNTFLNEPELRVRRIPKSIASMSMPRNKALNMKTFYTMKYQSSNELNEVCTSSTHDRHQFPLSTGVVDKMQPLNSVSGASQVTGPSFSEFKNGSFKLPSKKVVSGGPKLRTATRSRNRCNSPGLPHDSTRVYRSSESQNAPSNVSRHSSTQSREGSRNVSSNTGSGSVRQREQRMCTQSRYARSARAQDTELENPECINRNWSSRGPRAVEIQKQSGETLKKPRKVSLVDVASKLMQKVNRASIRVPRNESTKKYTDVKATKDYNGSLPGQLSFRKGQIIKQKSFVAGPSDGMCYGYYRVGRLRKKKKGLFPITCVATEEPDALDEVSLTSSAKSAM